MGRRPGRVAVAARTPRGLVLLRPGRPGERQPVPLDQANLPLSVGARRRVRLSIFGTAWGCSDRVLERNGSGYAHAC